MQARKCIEIYEEEYDRKKEGRYEVLEKLGEGTFGQVKKAFDSVSGQFVAIKFVRMLSRKKGIPKAVFRELQSLKQLCGCEYIMQLQDVYADESNLCLVSEYVESDLSELIATAKDYLSRPILKIIVKMMFESIAFCHSCNIIHRDIKPSSKSCGSN
jgi:serine/threonine protein kinase